MDVYVFREYSTGWFKLVFFSKDENYAAALYYKNKHDCGVADVYAQSVFYPLENETAGKEHMCNMDYEFFCPNEVCISLKQGKAAAARPIVVVGEHVSCGQLIGAGDSPQSVPVYASIDGIVTQIRQIAASVYESVSHIVIRTDENVRSPFPHFLKPMGNEVQWMKNMGIIDMMHTQKPFFSKCFSGEKITELKIAAFDREPFVYSDYRLIVECPAKVIFGAKMLAKVFHMKKLSIYVCDDEIRYILEKTIGNYRKSIAPLECIRFLKVDENAYNKSCSIYNKSEESLWCSVVELCAVYDGYYDDKPMTGRGMTVGGMVKHPRNLWVPNGTSVRDLLEYCGGICGMKNYVTPELLNDRSLLVIEGGPLRGHCIDIESQRTSLTTESILVMPGNKTNADPCIMCRECCNVCPVELKPLYIEKALDNKPGLCHLLEADQCIECGWCSYVCPSHRRLKEKVVAGKKVPLEYHQHTNMEAARECGYIELDSDMAGLLEDLVPESQSGPYIHSRQSTRAMFDHLAGLLCLILLGYALVIGPQVILKGLVSAAVFAGLDILYQYLRSGNTQIRINEDLSISVLIALAFAGNIPMRWMVAAVLLAFIVSKTVVWNAALTGMTVILGIYSILYPLTGVESWWIAIFWMAAFIYLINEEIIVPWATVIFLGTFMLLGMSFMVSMVWNPMIFMGGIFLLNDYRNAGKNTWMQRVFAGFSGALCAVLAAFLPMDIAICLGLCTANIIACNLNTYTI